MVLGLRSRNKKGSSIQIDYVIHLVEIKPWPPLDSRRSTQSLLLQWQNGDQGTGSFGIVGGGDNIVVNESFTISLTLQPDKKARDKFRKSLLEFTLIEPRKDKSGKEQVVATATLNIAEYGVIEHDFSIGVPFNFKKAFKSSVQPVLFVQIEPFDKGSSKSSPNNGSSIPSLDRDGEDSFADMDGDNSEIASFTDDDISSHSSLTIASSTFEASRASPSRSDKETLSEFTRNDQNLSNGSTSSAKSMSSLSNSVNNQNPKPKFPERSMTSIQKKVSARAVPSTSSFKGYSGMDLNSKNYIQHLEHGDNKDGFNEVRKTVETIPQIVNVENTNKAPIEVETSISSIEIGSQSNQTNHQFLQARNENQAGSAVVGDDYVDVLLDDEKKEQNLQPNELKKTSFYKDSTVYKFIDDDSTTTPLEPQIVRSHLRHAKSHNYDSSGRNRLITGQVKAENGTKERVANREGSTSKIPRKGKESSNTSPNVKGKSTSKKDGGPKTELSGAEVEWNSKIEMLEEELTEAAALEVGLYSIVAEHGSSMNKVHAPARRLSRFYLHACRADSRNQLGSAARAIISGLVLVSKACGNDVPRLTFWLSNAIMLRAIVSQAAASDTPNLYVKNTEKSNGQTHHPDSNSIRKLGKSPTITGSTSEESDGWEDMESFVYALEKTESWIFSRIIESIWWQNLTQHMQPAVAKTSAISTKKSNSSKYGLGDQEQGNFSVELWKKAFGDACERICPIRAQGHECGCLSAMTRMIMERLVIRLDVAMFNAILRESAEEMPSDPLSDPITEPKVLPIVAGKLSFGAGAQLKNAIGNWTRWLSDLFETEDIDSPNDDECCSDETTPASFKSFRLLNALSDVMMLPFEMLTDKSTRKEVCPALGPAMIKRVFSSFFPDQFCPYPIPQSVIDALDSEDDLDLSPEVVSSHPCTAPPTVYSPPVVTSIKYKGFTLEVGNRNVTSDDELDEMVDTNLNLIFNDSLKKKPPAAAKNLGLMPKGDGKRKVVRYNLLWDIWKDC